MQWYIENPSRWKVEQAIASTFLNDCEAGFDENDRAQITGTFDIISEHGHKYDTVKLRFVYPPKFPWRNQPPSVYLDDHRDCWINGGYSHIESDWKLCLFVPGESGINFSLESSLTHLFELIHVFLIKERIYQKRLLDQKSGKGIAEWPGEDRAHGIEGIQEAVQAMKRIGRNDPCPCGSGKKFKRCHMHVLQNR